MPCWSSEITTTSIEANRLAMSRQTFIFVSAPPEDADLMHLIEQALGRQFTREEGSDPTSESALSRFTSVATSLTMMTSPGRRARTSRCKASTRS
jgi:hypothetical protein